MKMAKLKVVGSVQWPGNVSLRGPEGQAQFDPPQRHITNAGFEDGEDVVLVLAEDYAALLKAMESPAIKGTVSCDGLSATVRKRARISQNRYPALRAKGKSEYGPDQADEKSEHIAPALARTRKPAMEIA